MNIHQSADPGKVIDPLRIRDGKVDAAVTHGCSKVIVPVSAVQAIAFIKVHDEGHIG